MLFTAQILGLHVLLGVDPILVGVVGIGMDLALVPGAPMPEHSRSFHTTSHLPVRLSL